MGTARQPLFYNDLLNVFLINNIIFFHTPNDVVVFIHDMLLLLQWHLGMFADEYLPTLRGFESHYGYYQGCEDYYDHTYEANAVGYSCLTLLNIFFM